MFLIFTTQLYLCQCNYDAIFAYTCIDKREVLQQEYSQPPILPSPHFRWVVNTILYLFVSGINEIFHRKAVPLVVFGVLVTLTTFSLKEIFLNPISTFRTVQTPSQTNLTLPCKLKKKYICIPLRKNIYQMEIIKGSRPKGH